MAKVKFDIPQELIMFEEDATDEALKAGAEILTKRLKAKAPRDSGDMLNSIKPTKPSRNAWGAYIVIRPTGKDRKGMRNMEKAVYLEYGTAKTKGAKPFITPAVVESEDAVMNAMQKKYDEGIK